MNLPAAGGGRAFLAFLAYLAFVVYGSLLPFEYRDRTLDEALQQFAGIGYLNLGVTSRADWIANIVLYVPLAFLGCTWVAGMRGMGALRLLGVVLVALLCLSVAVSVEAVQIFFAPRTVSLNDLLAETLGTLGGIALWGLGRERIARLFDAFSEGGRQSVVAVIAAYGVVYVVLSLFPYDFIVSGSELAWKLESGNQGWLVAGGCGDWLRCGARLAGDALAIAPLGVLIAMLQPDAIYKRVFLFGALIGLVLECLQFLLASGVSQGLSIVMRGVGLVAGVAAGRLLVVQGPALAARLIRRSAPFVILPYVTTAAALNGWFSRPWLPAGEAFACLADVRVMPFYYHYFSTEPAAMASLLANAALYAPVGLVLWARRVAGARQAKHGAWFSALAAALLALPMELGKLFVPPKHPDFTDLLIAAAAAAFAYALATWVERVLIGTDTGQPAPLTAPAAPMEPAVSRAEVPSIDWPAPTLAGLLIGVPPLLAALFGLASYPIGAAFLGVALLVYGAALWRWPLLWFLLIPALLPALDLSPITGRLLLDEFDLVVLVTLAVGYARFSGLRPAPWPHPLLRIATALLWPTWAIATARGLGPLWAMPGDLPVGSHSPLDAWLVGKGLLWALLLVPILRRVPREALEAARAHVLNGLVAGLAAVTLVILWERHVFVGLLDFANVFRVTGTFSSMNTGGAYVEGFIAFAFPALAVWVLMQRNWALMLAGILAAGLSTYAMLVTFSRGGYAGLVAGLVVVALGMLRLRSGSPSRRRLGLAGLMTVVVAVAVPVLSGGFAQQRLARAAEDLSIRQAHWARALGLMDADVTAAFAGMGFGQYPTLYLLLADADKPPGTYRVMVDGDNPYLRLGAGESVFLDQQVNVEPGTRYTLSARVRRPFGAAPLDVPLCEKALLDSFECVWSRLKPEMPEIGWNRVEVQVDSGRLGSGGNWPHPPVKLSLHNPGGGPVDVDDVSLKPQDGRELIANGAFSDGVQRWLFVTDQDLAWHIHEQWVEMYFAQGLLGLLAIAVLLTGVGAVLFPAMWRGDLYATAFAAALAAFLTVGLLGSTMDTARMAMLVYLGALLPAGMFPGKERLRASHVLGARVPGKLAAP